MITLIIVGSTILITFFWYIVYLASKEIEESKKNKGFIDKFYRSDVTDKIDELIERMGKYKPKRIILGSYFWKQIPTTYTIEWKRGSGPHDGLKPRIQDTIIYKDVEIVHDKENEYTFDLK